MLGEDPLHDPKAQTSSLFRLSREEWLKNLGEILLRIFGRL